MTIQKGMDINFVNTTLQWLLKSPSNYTMINFDLGGGAISNTDVRIDCIAN
jgi:hypothetical protein